MKEDQISYMELCMHIDGKEYVFLRIPTVWDDVNKHWIGFIKTPVSKRLIYGKGKDSFDLQNSFNRNIHDLIMESEELGMEILSMFKSNQENINGK